MINNNKTSDKDPKPIGVIIQWMAALISYSMAGAVGSPKLICLCIDFSHYLDQRISDQFSQSISPW